VSSFPFPSPQSAKGTYAARHRQFPPGSPELVEAGSNLAAAKIAAYIERVVAAAPPLTAEQRDRLAGLLRGAA
jgi:hypothetical protein